MKRIAAALAATLALAGCQPHQAAPGQPSGGAAVHTGDVCMQLGRERLDAEGVAVRCLREPGEDAARWKRRPW